MTRISRRPLFETRHTDAHIFRRGGTKYVGFSFCSQILFGGTLIAWDTIKASW